MSGIEIVGLIATILTVIGLVEARVKSITKHYLAELKPNSGSSIKDQVTRLEQRLDDLYKHLLEK